MSKRTASSRKSRMFALRPIAGASLLVATAGAPPAHAAEHTLMPSPQTVHIGHFAANVKPVLTIESGDIVTIETAAAMEPGPIEESGAVPPSAVPQYVRDIYRDVKDRGPGPHILTGPIAINGAMPGDVLEVRILDVKPRACVNPAFKGLTFGSNAAANWGYHYNDFLTGDKPREVVTILLMQ